MLIQHVHLAEKTSHFDEAMAMVVVIKLPKLSCKSFISLISVLMKNKQSIHHTESIPYLLNG
jgi:hypothetical protein